MAHGLSASDVESYHTNGYLCPIDVLSNEEVSRNRNALETLEREHDGKLPRRIGEYLRISAYLATDVPLRIARDPRVLDKVESILGPDILMWSCEYFIKEANSRQIVSWHQDLTYWGMDGSDHEVTAWVALSPANAESGGMRFVPGSHKESLVPHEDTFDENNLLSRGQEIAVDVDEEDAIVAALEPGQMSLHHGRLFHASGPNTSNDRRIGLVIRYIRPDTPANGANKDFAMLMRGIDRMGTRLHVSPPPGSFTSRHLEIYEEVLARQSEFLSEGLESSDQMYRKDKEPAHV